MVFGHAIQNLRQITPVYLVLRHQRLLVWVAGGCDGAVGLAVGPDETDSLYGHELGPHGGFHACHAAHDGHTNGANVDILPVCAQVGEALDDCHGGASSGEPVGCCWAGDGCADDEDSQAGHFCSCYCR